MVREGLRLLLAAEADFEVVGVAATGSEVLQHIGEWRPDVIVATLPAEFIWQATHRWPGAAIVILSRYDSDPYVLDALGSGVGGCVLEQEEPQELFHAVRVAVSGRYLSRSLSQRAFEVYARGAGDSLLASAIGGCGALRPNSLSALRSKSAERRSFHHCDPLKRSCQRSASMERRELNQPPGEGFPRS